MGYRNLLSEDRGAIRTITINRPDKLNALNRETIGELALAFEQARHDDAIRVVVLAGAGEKAFVAGADISELATAVADRSARTRARRPGDDAACRDAAANPSSRASRATRSAAAWSSR